MYSCCEEQNHNAQGKNSQPKWWQRHGSMMLICAGVILGAALLFRGQVSKLAPYALLLICPLMHVGMMFVMGHNMHNHNKQAEKMQEHGPLDSVSH